MRTPEAQERFDRALDLARQAGAGAQAPDGMGGHSLSMRAIAEGEAAREHAPADPEILLFLAVHYAEEMLREKSIVCYQEAIQAAAQEGNRKVLVEAKVWHAFFLHSRGKGEEAIRDLEEALALAPEDPQARALEKLLVKNREEKASPRRKRSWGAIGCLSVLGGFLLLAAQGLYWIRTMGMGRDPEDPQVGLCGAISLSILFICLPAALGTAALLVAVRLFRNKG